jgi:hypothetical protein
MRRVFEWILVAIFFAAFVAVAPAIATESVVPAAPVATAKITPAEHVRGLEQTFLTYPEWFLVFSPAEYADFIAKEPPSFFPYFGHIGQFWQSYKAVFNETRARGLDLNPGYHLMIMVIGVSTTVEYALKSFYEHLMGRFTELTRSAPTAEDRYAASVAKDYVDFIRVLPWYEYDFWSKLKGLWSDTPVFGQNMLRKWERRFALTTEYGIKVIYGQMIKLATKSIYESPLLVTAVLVKPAPSPNSKLPEVKPLQSFPDGSALVTVPRYEAFMVYAQGLALQGVDFREIAGNETIILVSLIGPESWTPKTGISKILFEQPILTQRGFKRVAATIEVQSMGKALREWSEQRITVEHIFDY